jgi:hypothetical protein
MSTLLAIMLSLAGASSPGLREHHAAIVATDATPGNRYGKGSCEKSDGGCIECVDVRRD